MTFPFLVLHHISQKVQHSKIPPFADLDFPGIHIDKALHKNSKFH